MKRMFIALFATLAITSAPAWAQPADMSGLMGALGAMMGGGSQTNATPIVDFRELKKVMPDSAASLKRTSLSGEKNSAMGMTISHAEAEYESSKEGRGSIKITDYGATGMAAMMNTAWSSREIDRESDDGYERTTTINGQKAVEKFNTSSNSGTIELIVASRFMIEIEVNNSTAADMQALAGAIDFKALAALK